MIEIACPACGRGTLELARFKNASTAKCSRGCLIKGDANTRRADREMDKLDTALKRLGGR